MPYCFVHSIHKEPLNYCSNTAVPCVKHKGEPEILPVCVMWFETGFERTALSSNTLLELRAQVPPWKKCLMEVQSLGPFYT